MSTNDLARPKDLNAIGGRAYEVITAYLKEHGRTDTGGCRAFYSPAEWRARGEKHGAAAHLIIVYDGGGLRPVFSMNAACELRQTDTKHDPYALYEGMQEALSKAGLYFEECTTWYSGIYSIHPAPVRRISRS